jgi:hypothetical protein
MKNAMPTIIQKSDYDHNKQLRTLVLSTNVNDYDTGELIVGGSIRKTLASSSQMVDNPILSVLNGVKLGRKYCTPTVSGNTIASDQDPKSLDRQQSRLLLLL